MGSHHSKNDEINKPRQTKLEKAIELSNKRYGFINWDAILRNNFFSEYDIEQYKDTIDWERVCECQKVTKLFLIKYRNRINFDSLGSNKHLTESIIEEFIDDLPAHTVKKAIETCQLSNQFVIQILLSRKHPYYAGKIFQYYKLPESVLDTIKIEPYDTAFKNAVSRYQCLSETFMLKHAFELNWNILTQYQRMSLPFIQQNEARIDWNKLSYNKYLEYDVVLKYREKLIQTEEVENAVRSGRTQWVEPSIEIYKAKTA